MHVNLTVSTFRADCTDKEQAVKVLEETNEAYAAWQILDDALGGDESDGFTRELVEAERERLADELADTITACANLAERYELDLQAALVRVERKNRERGRYD